MSTCKIVITNLLFLCLLSCNEDLNDHMTDDSKSEMEQVISSFPSEKVVFDNFNIFKSDGENWQLAEDIYSDYNDGSVFELESGSGILVNKMIDSKNEALYSTFDHGDLELKFEYLIPKGSNSGVYFQGRYELQLFDSYGVETPKISDSGAIYERWDDSRPEGSKGYEGHPPLVNTSKAPGLWQEMKIYFRAPKFDNSGQKIENARFESVYHNGILIQDNIELNGPTRGPFIEGESAYGPLVIQGDHGNVAFRNLSYKSYTQDSLEITDLTFKYFEHPYGNSFPDFDTVQILKEGPATYFDANIANEKNDHYGLIFTGKLIVPQTGEYLFKTGLDDGGDLLINNKLVVHNEVNPGYSEANGIVELDSGMVEIELRYYDDNWRSTINIDYEGPNIYFHPLGRIVPKKNNNRKRKRALIETMEEPEIYRNFSLHKGLKRTHAISVGSPSKVHYTYDLNEGALLKFWRGNFADMSEMWINRGQPQLLHPLNASIESVDGIPLGSLSKDESRWTSMPLNQLHYKGYEISSDGFPLFSYDSPNLSWTDKIKPSSNGKELERTIKKTSGSAVLSARIAQGENIKRLPNNLYSIDGKYYIRLLDPSKGKILSSNQNELILLFDKNGIVTYNVFW